MQPNNPDPNQQATNPTPNAQPTGRMIQPLSSEDDIRKEAEAARPEQPAPSQTAGQANQFSTTNTGNPEPVNAYEQSSLITEPIHRPSQIPQPQLHTSSLDQSPQDTKKGKGVFVVIGLIVVAALAISAYFFLFNNKVTVADLVQETFQQ